MSTQIEKVQYIEQMEAGGRPSVNDYLAITGWILLNVTEGSTIGDAGRRSWSEFTIGWVGDGAPVYPTR